ncbi:hypothetical protein Tco_0496488 [Tanacetum coccineum]
MMNICALEVIYKSLDRSADEVLGRSVETFQKAGSDYTGSTKHAWTEQTLGLFGQQRIRLYWSLEAQSDKWVWGGSSVLKSYYRRSHSNGKVSLQTPAEDG